MKRILLFVCILIVGVLLYVTIKDDNVSKNVYDAELVIANNGNVIKYDLQSGEYEEFDIYNVKDEHKYNMAVYEGMVTIDNKFIVRNPEFIQILSTDLKEVKKIDMDETNNNSPYLNSIQIYNDQIYYISNSHVNDKMQAVSCELYNNEYTCIDNVIDSFVYKSGNNLYTLLDLGDGKGFTIRIRNGDNINSKEVKMKDDMMISGFIVCGDYYYVVHLHSNRDGVSNISKYDKNLNFIDKINVGAVLNNSNSLYYKDGVIYLVENESVLVAIDEETFKVKYRYEIELDEEDANSMNKHEFVDDKLFMYFSDWLVIVDIDDQKVLVNQELVLPKGYARPYQLGSVSAILKNKN